MEYLGDDEIPIAMSRIIKWRENILWGVMGWYLAEVVKSGGGSAEIWGRALGIAVVVGVILCLSAIGKDGTFRTLEGWRLVRFFLIPFCVSSYSNLTQGKAYWLVFAPQAGENLLNLHLAGTTILLLGVARRLRRRPCPLADIQIERGKLL